jgi:hypothetical protein
VGLKPFHTCSGHAANNPEDTVSKYIGLVAPMYRKATTSTELNFQAAACGHERTVNNYKHGSSGRKGDE